MDSEVAEAGHPPTSVEWSVDLDRFEVFRLDVELIRQVQNGFQISVGQTGGKGYSLIRTAMIRRGSRSRMFWVAKNKTACVVLCRDDIANLAAGQALVFEGDGAVFVLGGR
jgi:hypothetical protein